MRQCHSKWQQQPESLIVSRHWNTRKRILTKQARALSISLKNNPEIQFSSHTEAIATAFV